MPTENKKDPLSSSQRRGKQPNCHGKHAVPERFTALDSLGGLLGEESGWVPSGEGGAVLLGEQCLELAVSLCNGEIGFPSDCI